MNGVVYVSKYVPQRCGLATYTRDLRVSVMAARGSRILDPVVRVVPASDLATAAGDPSVWPLVKEDRKNYIRITEKVNRSGVSVVSLQHEFGIFGGEAGEYVLEFVRRLRKPLVTTFHTVFEKPEEPYRSIQEEIAHRSDRIVVMNREAVRLLERSFRVSPAKIVFIPHGTSAPDARGREAARKSLGWDGRLVLMTFGLLSRGKGIELVLDALPAVARRVPNVLYAIVGQTHPEVLKYEGESYRDELRRRICKLGLDGRVVMVDRYLENDELVRYLTACDIYVTPYPGMQQITSGTLAYAVGLGRPVLSTPYCYARDLLKGFEEELLIPYGDVERWADAIASLLADKRRLRALEARIEAVGRTMRWPAVGTAQARLFAEVAADVASSAAGGERVTRFQR